MARKLRFIQNLEASSYRIEEIETLTNGGDLRIFRISKRR